MRTDSLSKRVSSPMQSTSRIPPGLMSSHSFIARGKRGEVRISERRIGQSLPRRGLLRWRRRRRWRLPRGPLRRPPGGLLGENGRLYRTRHSCTADAGALRSSRVRYRHYRLTGAVSHRCDRPRGFRKSSDTNTAEHCPTRTRSSAAPPARRAASPRSSPPSVRAAARWKRR